MATQLISEKTEALYAERNKRVEVVTSRYSATGNILQYIYSVLKAKNHQIIRSRCLFQKFSFTAVFNDVNWSYRATIVNKNFL